MPIQDNARKEVEKLINGSFYTLVREDWKKVDETIREWFSRYKDFEAQDKFSDAFGDQRMTVRFIKQTEIIKDMAAWTKEALEPAIPGTIKKLESIDGKFVQTSVPTLTKVKGAVYGATGNQLDTTAKGLCLRMAPENFEGGSTNHIKYDKGLHDLSGSLLTKDRPISKQVFNKSLEQGALIAFMPLSPPEDQVLFQKLNSLAKEYKNQDFTKLIQYIRSRMTRIKVACEGDISANFVNVSPADGTFPKYKYGIGTWSKVKNEQNVEVQKYVGQEEVNRRKRLALTFKEILTKDSDKVNEIIVAFREHKNKMFPLFTRLEVTDTGSGKTYSYRTFELEGRSLANRILTDTGGGVG